MTINGKRSRVYPIHCAVSRAAQRSHALHHSDVGPAVTLDDKDSLYIFGGYDLLSGSVLFRNDFLQLEDLTSTKYDITPRSTPLDTIESLRWIKLKSRFNFNDKSQPVLPRARALLVACGDDVISPEGGLFACGGYTKSPSGELAPVPEILCYDNSTKDWTYLSDIPNLTKLNIFAVENNMLIISERVKSSEPDEDDELIPISKYDLAQRKWLMIDRKETTDTDTSV